MRMTRSLKGRTNHKTRKREAHLENCFIERRLPEVTIAKANQLVSCLHNNHHQIKSN